MFELIVLTTHITAGFIALIAGSFILVTKKGTNLHVKTGLLFYPSMLVIGFSALLLSGLKLDVFLFCIGIFSLFQTYFGKRSISNRTLVPNFLDVFVTLIALGNGIVMVISGNMVLIVFGAIQLQLCFTEFYIFYRIKKKIQLPKNAWLRQHIGMMMGSYIATFTAFLVVNVDNFEPNWLIWLAPTFVFVPLMFFWSKKFAS